MIGRLADTTERDGVVVFNEDFKVVTSVQMQLLTDRAGQHNLAFL